MNPYALPSFIAFASVLLLGLAAILQNPKGRDNRLLGAFCFNFALTIGAGGMLHQSTSELEAIFWNKWPYIFGLPSYILMLEYGCQISGGHKRLKERFLWLPISFHRWAIYGTTIVMFLVLLFTDLIISPPKYYSTTGWEHSYGNLFLLLMSIGSYFLVCISYIILRGIKLSKNPAERKARIITLVAVGGVQICVYIPGMILPFIGIQTHSYASFGWIFMCFFLTYGLLKFQWETIQNLNRGLEEKITKRTEELVKKTKELNLANENLKGVQKQISKYIDPNVAEKIFEGEFTAELSHRRTKLTMLFSDIQDFTQFTDACDPEDVAKLLNEYLGEMALIVRAWGGTIPQFTGDSIYAIFGDPDSKGERDDALACVKLAVEMQGRMKALREKWWNQGIQFPFEIRCGIHTGMANVGNYGSEGFMEYSAIGLNTNLASRLEQVCVPGEIYLSHATWALVKEEIACEEVGTIEVKGFHYPIQTYRVLLSDEKIASVSEMQ